MDVDDPGDLGPFLVSVKKFSPTDRETTRPVYTHKVAKKAAIISKISASLFVVSSNPGVSMRITALPSRVNTSANLTSAVHDSKPIPTRRFEPLARLINWSHPSEFLVVITGHAAYR